MDAASPIRSGRVSASSIASSIKRSTGLTRFSDTGHAYGRTIHLCFFRVFCFDGGLIRLYPRGRRLATEKGNRLEIFNQTDRPSICWITSFFPLFANPSPRISRVTVSRNKAKNLFASVCFPHRFPRAFTVPGRPRWPRLSAFDARRASIFDQGKGNSIIQSVHAELPRGTFR